jgi:hypothetical protein
MDENTTIEHVDDETVSSEFCMSMDCDGHYVSVVINPLVPEEEFEKILRRVTYAHRFMAAAYSLGALADEDLGMEGEDSPSND